MDGRQGLQVLWRSDASPNAWWIRLQIIWIFIFIQVLVILLKLEEIVRTRELSLQNVHYTYEHLARDFFYNLGELIYVQLLLFFEREIQKHLDLFMDIDDVTELITPSALLSEFPFGLLLFFLREMVDWHIYQHNSNIFFWDQPICIEIIHIKDKFYLGL